VEEAIVEDEEEAEEKTEDVGEDGREGMLVLMLKERLSEGG
jgi:hypothetical protein